LCSWTPFEVPFGEALTVLGRQGAKLSSDELREARYLLAEARVIPSTSRRPTTD
jgi:hypothetical protein